MIVKQEFERWLKKDGKAQKRGMIVRMGIYFEVK